MLGAIVGDIIGSVYEWNNVKTTDFELFPRGSRFTDDTVMTIAVCEALMEHDYHRFSSERTAKFMQKWGRKYPHAGYGGSFKKWLQEEKPKPYGSWANGSAMRVSGCGLIASDIDEALEYAESSAAATHNHLEGIKGAQAIAAAIFWAKNGMSKAFIKDYITKKFGYNLDRKIEDIRPSYRFDVSCKGSVPEAIIAFLQGNDFEEVIRLAISLGGDSDTIAAMAGSIAACVYDIPDQMIENCRALLPEEMLSVMDRFEKEVKESREGRIKNKCIGCLLGGAAGDALGYPIEFMSRAQIIEKYGENHRGIYQRGESGKMLISDDTQMTMFTANALLMGLTRGYMRGVGGIPETYVKYGYMDWYATQSGKDSDAHHSSWIYALPELHALRAPGGTCLSAIRSIIKGEEVRNNSKGCGGIMRVAPMALLNAGYKVRTGNSPYTMERLAEAGACIASVTHKHPLGYIPSAFLTVLLYRILVCEGSCDARVLEWLIDETYQVIEKVYQEEHRNDLLYLKNLIDKAIALSHSHISPEKAIAELGEGWVAEETLAIALYCALKGQNREVFEISVCHDGDSDSTGSVTGNIVGAMYGQFSIPDWYLGNIQLEDVIVSLAEDLYSGCPISEFDPMQSEEKRQWYTRYCLMKPCGLGCHDIVAPEDDFFIKYGDYPSLYNWSSYDKEPECGILFFWKIETKGGIINESCLSQWWRCSFIDTDGSFYSSVEQYIMASKARLFDDKDTLKEIMEESDPAKIKALGRRVRNFDNDKWERARYHFALEGNKMKFMQNEELKRYLLSTDNKLLAEASPFDDIWGIGLKATDKEARIPKQWKGRNLLGRALMDVRIFVKSAK